MQDDDAVGQGHDHAHDVFDQQHRHAPAAQLLNDLDDPVTLGGPQSRHHLIEQKETRFGRDGARQLQHLAVRQCEIARQRIGLGLQADPHDACCRDARRFIHVGDASERAHHHVLQDRQADHRPYDLECANEASQRDLLGRKSGQVFTVEEDPSGRRPQRACDQIEAGGLAGAVRSDKGDDLPFGDIERDVFHRDQTAEGLCQIADLQHHQDRLAATKRTMRGQMPSGRNAMTPRMTAP